MVGMMLPKRGVITRERLDEQPQVHGELGEDREEDVRREHRRGRAARREAVERARPGDEQEEERGGEAGGGGLRVAHAHAAQVQHLSGREGIGARAAEVGGRVGVRGAW